jgi:hypothetical protein
VRPMRMKRRSAAAVSVFCGVIFPAAAFAVHEDADSWEFKATLYLYLPTLSGSTAFPPEDGSSGISVDTATILDNLKLTFMGSFEARKGPWGAFTDLIYIDLGNTRTVSRGFYIGGLPLPVDVTANAEFDIKGWLWTLAATYRPVSTVEHTLDVLAGTRLLDIKPKLSWQLSGNVGSVAPPDRAGSRESGVSNWDLIAGIKGRASFGPGRNWFALYYLDLGAGNSRFTGQAMAGTGYTFQWGELSVAWRYIDYQMKSSDTIERLNLTGPLVAYQFRW